MVHYRGYKIDVLLDQYEVFQGQKLVATGFGYDNALAHAKELINNEFVTPLLAELRKIKEAEVAASKERQDAEANETDE